MSRKKLILSISLLAALVAAGIIFPSYWNLEHQRELKTLILPESSRPLKKSTKSKEETKSTTELNLKGFDALTAFFSEIQVEELKSLFSDYFSENDRDITSITFLPEQTKYPDGGSTLLYFLLSDGSEFPVTYSTSSGAFFFGEDQKQVSTDTKTYEREIDENLPSYTSDEVFSMEEGGYADTPDDEPAGEVTP